mmetsp:Transcript_71634/g.226259  ORF Transcript_71634/g.226259 Transcript_71634/m.226259 type:complete len:415 (-) Transcript_71634:765-2009(-)
MPAEQHGPLEPHPRAAQPPRLPAEVRERQQTVALPGLHGDAGGVGADPVAPGELRRGVLVPGPQGGRAHGVAPRPPRREGAQGREDVDVNGAGRCEAPGRGDNSHVPAPGAERGPARPGGGAEREHVVEPPQPGAPGHGRVPPAEAPREAAAPPVADHAGGGLAPPGEVPRVLPPRGEGACQQQAPDAPHHSPGEGLRAHLALPVLARLVLRGEGVEPLLLGPRILLGRGLVLRGERVQPLLLRPGLLLGRPLERREPLERRHVAPEPEGPGLRETRPAGHHEDQPVAPGTPRGSALHPRRHRPRGGVAAEPLEDAGGPPPRLPQLHNPAVPAAEGGRDEVEGDLAGEVRHGLVAPLALQALRLVRHLPLEVHRRDAVAPLAERRCYGRVLEPEHELAELFPPLTRLQHRLPPP